MVVYVLEMLFETLGIRGHIPRFDNDPPWTGPSLTANKGALGRFVVAVMAVVLFLAATLWIAVWLALKLL